MKHYEPSFKLRREFGGGFFFLSIIYISWKISTMPKIHHKMLCLHIFHKMIVTFVIYSICRSYTFLLSAGTHLHSIKITAIIFPLLTFLLISLTVGFVPIDIISHILVDDSLRHEFPPSLMSCGFSHGFHYSFSFNGTCKVSINFIRLL